MNSTNKFQRKVLKQYPQARPISTVNGVQIMNDGIFIAKEFYMPITNCEKTAWEYAAIACRTKQNFDRTHPDKMDLSDIESKINRINNRKRRGRRYV
tara:strand:+ start:110 stop:400 length:291 start_codon:yes stop_codon:yes gene_type:complete